MMHGKCSCPCLRRRNATDRPVTALWTDLPLTLDTIQLGMHRLAMANTSAAKNKAPDIMLSLSITLDT